MSTRKKRKGLSSHRAESMLETLERVRVATGRYARAQRRRDIAYRDFLATIREAASSHPPTPVSVLAQMSGLTTTRVRQMVTGRVSKRDSGLAPFPGSDALPSPWNGHRAVRSQRSR